MKKSVMRSGEQGARRGMQVSRMATEIPLATFITLSHRVPMVWWAAMGMASAQDPEFQRMVVEKAEAGVLSSSALGRGGMAAASAVTRFAQDQGKATVALTQAFLSSDTAKMVQAMSTASCATADCWSDLAARLNEASSKAAYGCVAPAHARVTANAKRLSNKR